MNWERQQMLAELLAQLDEINDGIRDCLDTLSANAEITRMVIREFMGAAEPAPKPSFDLSKVFPSSNEPKEEKSKENKDGLNIFDEDFEEKIAEENEKVTSKMSKKTIMGPMGPIDVFEVKMGEDMTEEEVAKEIQKHMKNIRKMFDPQMKDEDDDNETPTWT